MNIPPLWDLPILDWSQLSPEPQEPVPAADNPDVQDGTILEDIPTLLIQSLTDPSRTRALCELTQTEIPRLATKVRTEKYEIFLRLLHSRNPGTPRMIAGNMASIFAQPGKMTRTQAGGSYTFKISDTLGYGLAVPTRFRPKPGFQNETSNKYFMIHGTTCTRTATILLENLLRPEDFSMQADHLFQGDFPTYGYCSTGFPAEDDNLTPLKVRQLTKKILMIGKGSMEVFICGTYSGRHPPQKYNVTHPDEAQVLCGMFGIANGLQNTLVARPAHTTINAVVLPYQHGRDQNTLDERSTSLGSVKSSSNLSNTTVGD